MNLESLRNAVSNGAALRYRARLQPAGGQGDKVFPPTYEGGKYAEETRRIDGNVYDCIHLDSVQSQANRMELALLEASKDPAILLPVPRVEVDFASRGADLAEVGAISSLEAPHRLADAILRDSVNTAGKRFRETTEGDYLNTASIKNATGLFEISPTSLLFGIWDSTGPRGGMGVKFQRAIVSELVAIDVEKGVKTASRIDPLAIEKEAGIGKLFQGLDGGWTMNAALAKQKDNKPLIWGEDGKKVKEGKPSEINHGNVTPSVSETNGGVTFSHALQISVISLPALRRLQFPVDGIRKPATDLMAQTTLAALGLAAAVLSIDKGADLRSRCLLVPETPGVWELVGSNGQIEVFKLSASEACDLLKAAVVEATKVGLKWRLEPVVLQPSEGLTQLVRRTRELASQSKIEG